MGERSAPCHFLRQSAITQASGLPETHVDFITLKYPNTKTPNTQYSAPNTPKLKELPTNKKRNKSLSQRMIQFNLTKFLANSSGQRGAEQAESPLKQG